MMCDTELNIAKLYAQYNRLVISICRKFVKRLPGNELEDLTQSCWERIIKEAHTYDEEKAQLSTWISKVSTTTLYNMIRDSKFENRKANLNTDSYEQLMQKYNRKY